MKTPTASTNSSDELPVGSLIIYENDGTPILGAVIGFKKRYIVGNDRGRDIELPRDRLHRLPGLLPGDCKTADGRVKFFEELKNSATVAAQGIIASDLWAFVNEKPRDYSTQELCELYFGKDALVNHLGLYLNLIADGIYFKRRAHEFCPRDSSVVEQLKQAEAARLERLERDRIVVEFFGARLKDRSLPIPPSMADDVALLEGVASGAAAVEQQLPQAEALLTLCAERLKIELRGTLSQQAYDLLIEIGQILPVTNLALLRHRPPLEFSSELETAANETVSPITAEPSRADLTALDVFTVDDDTTEDIDDGVSIEQTIDGYRVGIHISDIASLIGLESPLDKEALRRGTSIYCPERTIHMFPRGVSCNSGSLLPGLTRKTVSYLCDFDSQWRLQHWKIALTTTQSKRRISYEQVDKLLDEGSDRQLNLLSELASNLESQRIQNGAIKVQKRDVSVAIAEDGTLSLFEYDENSPARMMIGELMILANSLSAEFAISRTIPVLYRSQVKPDDNHKQNLDEIPAGPARDYAIRSRLKRSEISTQPKPHASLALKAYTQVTSPIRRYADLIAQRQLVASLRNEALPYSTEQLADLIPSLEETLQRATVVSRESRRFWLLKILQEFSKEKREIDGVIIRIDPRFVIVELDTVFITAVTRLKTPPKLGQTLRLRIAAIDPHFDLLRLEEVGQR